MSRYERLVTHLADSVGRFTGLPPAEIDPAASFLELGADSLTLLQLSQTIQDDLGVKVPFRLLLDELDNLDALARHVEPRLPATWPPEAKPEPAPTQAAAAAVAAVPSVAAAPPAPAPAPPAPRPRAAAAAPMLAASGVERLLERQLDILTQQLELLRGRPLAPAPTLPAPAPPAPEVRPKPAGDEPEEFVPYKPIARSTGRQGLTPQQQEYLEALIERINAKTAESKRLAELDRRHHADSRAITGFRRLWKELSYPLAVTDGFGGRIRDVDGNEYVDLTMGFGSLLFGHTPPFLLEILAREVPRGVRLGPQSYLAGEVARLISELTGVERVTFCNSGTEAVMTAMRLARAFTRRTKIALFAGSYHGTADEVLVRPEMDGGHRALPLAPGVPPAALADILVFRYNRPESLVELAGCIDELAAVMVEPPRSRTPDIQPLEFLQGLRRLTAEHGAALIFDEVVTGFRTHPGGAQAIFGVKPDLVTFGKAVAAGMPIGIVAGKAEYMDAVDGGMWQYGDDSFPTAELSYHAGTFCKHPFTMPVMKAVLEHLKEAGPALQEELSRRTAELAATLNAFFEEEGYPFRVVRFGSLFRFTYPPALRLGELFYYHLLEHGVYVWEGRNFFLCTAHTADDLEQIVAAVKASAAAMRAGGVFDSELAPSLPGESPPSGARQPPAAPAGAETGGDTAPLTEAQEQLWVLAQLGDEGSRAYNESLTLELRGPLDVAALHRSLETVVGRHEALRATFAVDGSGQRFAPPGPVALPVVKLTTAGEIEAWIDAEAGRVFDLAAGPLYRAHLLKAAADRHLLVLTLHHLVSDGVSNAIVLNELSRLYSAAYQGQSCELPPAVPYRDYVARLRDEQEGSEIRRAEAFWLAAYAEPAPFLDLPTDRPRPPLQGHLGDRARATIAGPLVERVRGLARSHRATLLVTLLSAYQTLLHRLSGQRDVVVGIPAAGQIGERRGNLVGYCVNLLPIRSRTTPRTTVAEQLAATRGWLLDADEHRLYPFSRLIKRLDLRHDPSRLPLVAVTFNTERAGALGFHGLEAELRSNSSGGAKFELFMNVTEGASALELDCEYNSFLFEATTLGRWLEHLEQLLTAMAADPGARLEALPLLGAAARHQLLQEWNDTATAVEEALIHHLFEDQVRRDGDAVAAEFGERALTYRQLDERANQLAHHLAAQGVRPGDRVAVFLHRSLEMVPALLGVLKTGAAYVPIEVSYPVERGRWILEAQQIRVAVTGAAELPDLGRLADAAPVLRHAVVLDSDETRLQDLGVLAVTSAADVAARPVHALSVPVTPNHVAYVIFTSGSTGAPKGVVETHAVVTRLLRWVNRTFDVGPRDRVLFVTSLCFDLSVYDVFGLLAAGGSIRVAAEEDVLDPERLLAWLGNDAVTFWDSAPAALQQLVPFFDGAALPPSPALRLAFLSGDWIPLELPGRLRAHFPEVQVIALGGATEATVWSNFHRVRALDPRWVSIPYGRPIADARYLVLDAELRPAPIGVAGDLYIGGRCLSSGYAGAPRLTAERYLPDPYSAEADAVMYRTGDRARFYADGEIEFLGRLDSQVKVRGFRIELGEIDAALSRHPELRDAVTVALGVPQQDRRLVAYIVPRPGRSPGPAELRAFLSERLPEYMVPAVYVTLRALPVTPNGKLDRRALPAPELPERESVLVLPQTPLEQRLAEIWREQLGVEQIGLHDNFFTLGGDSILAIRIVARVRAAGLPLAATDVFQHPTLAELAALERLAGAAGDGDVALTPIQRWLLERDLPALYHYNQAALLTVPAGVTAPVLTMALRALVRRHDALRLQLVQAAGDRRLRDAGQGAVEAVACPRIDLAALTAAGREAALAAAGAQLQASLDPERGPLLRAALFAGGADGAPDALFLAVHHLAVDVTSWQILTAELAAAVAQLRVGRAVELPPATTALREWARRLAEHARTPAVQAESALWRTAAAHRGPRLPVDLDGGPDVEGAAQRVTAELDARETQALLREVPKAYRTLTEEVLLTALTQAVSEWAGGAPAVPVELEGNAREVDVGGMQLLRTVGWLTTLYPVVLEAPAGAGPGEALQAVKEQLRRVPDQGLGYGLLRYLGEPETAAELAAAPPPEIGFLYVGGLGELGGEDRAFASLRRPIGPAIAPRNPRPHLLEVTAGVVGERLRVDFGYSVRRHHPATIERLAAGFLAALRRLIEHCCTPAAGKVTPADFPQADVSQEELDELLAQFSEEAH